jgi:hypothetical protein
MKEVRRGLGRFGLAAAICLAATNGLTALPATAQSCAEVVADGGFEAGGAWQLGATPVPPEYVTYSLHTGARSLALGITQGANAQSYSSARQLVTIPAGADEARLTFWTYAVVGAESGLDKMQLVLLKPDGATLAVIWTSNGNNPTWSQLSYDLTQWRGQAVQLYFNVINDGVGGTTGMFLDDVSLVVCPNSALTPVATPPAAPVTGEPPPDPPPSVTPSASPDDLAEMPAPVDETPAAGFFTPEPAVDSQYSESGSQPLLAEPATPEAAEPLLSSGTPAMVFFTPTAEPGLSSAAPQISQSGAGAATQQLTRVSLMVTPDWTLPPRSAQVTAVPLATRRAAAPQAPGDAPFAQWPKGWWFAVGAVLAIILAAGLFSRRSS